MVLMRIDSWREHRQIGQMCMWKLGRILFAFIFICAGCGGSDNPAISKPSSAPSTQTNSTSTNATAAAAPKRAPTSLDPNFPTQPQPRLRTIKVWVGAEEIIAEIAASEKEIMTGMMNRTEIQENEGMLFVFPNAAPRAFWMKNCLIPLSCAYIEPEGTIAETHAMYPMDEKPIQSKSDRVQFVLEMKEGWFKRHNIGAGVVVRTDRGTLLQTFFARRTQP
jgi:uncharacterized membrane protein (UPF0127 family)